ncbi:hypothetical protein ACFQZQ_09680 [Lysobacter koreensis]|uniref:Alpha/beta hydrolase n=1 Tax=Lysobacter koreensis TaxID=266122 RepID=A0ABW2YST9_9GAMM
MGRAIREHLDTSTAAAGSLGAANDRDRAAASAVYIHGLGNHADEHALTARWDRALFGRDLDGHSRMAYWVDRARYPQSEGCDCADPVCGCGAHEEPGLGSALAGVCAPIQFEMAIRAATGDAEQRAFLREIGLLAMQRAKAQAAGNDGRQRRDSHGRAVAASTGLGLPDAVDFLFDPARRRHMEDVFRQRLHRDDGPCVVVAHSQGSLIAYDVLRQLRRRDIDVRLFVTVGSPLGLAPLRRVIQSWVGQTRLPFPACVRRWVNVVAAGDVLAFDPQLPDAIALPARGGTFEQHCIGREERDRNPLFAGNPHAALGYLSSAIVQQCVRAAWQAVASVHGGLRELATRDSLSS